MTDTELLKAAKAISENCLNTKDCGKCPFMHEGKSFLDIFCIVQEDVSRWAEYIDDMLLPEPPKGSDAKWSIEWDDSIREHETTMFKPIVTDTRGYACQFSCNACDCIVSRAHYMRPSQFDYNYCPYCGRPVVESEDDAE